MTLSKYTVTELRAFAKTHNDLVKIPHPSKLKKDELIVELEKHFDVKDEKLHHKITGKKYTILKEGKKEEKKPEKKEENKEEQETKSLKFIAEMRPKINYTLSGVQDVINALMEVNTDYKKKYMDKERTETRD